MADPTKEPPGKRKVAAIVSGAIEDLERQADRKRIVWPPRGMKYEGINPGGWRAESFLDDTEQLPDHCPVTPLGYDGETHYFVDTAGQVFSTGTQAFGRERILKLFMGSEEFLCWAWPKWGKGGSVAGYAAEDVQRDLYAANYVRGPWSPTDMVRGRGAWKGENGELILHCGEFLWIDGEKHEPGEYGAYFYVRRPKTIAPWNQAVALEDNPAVMLVRILRTWNFVRGDVDVMLILGWIGVALYGAALDWRPSIFFVGDAGTGKSEFHRVLKAILMRGLISTTNATSAGLYQLVGHDALPIAIDELENDDNPDQAQQIIKMARDAASGSVRIRGGQNHQGVEFAARSSFMFSAVNPPPLPATSLSRLAMIQMRPLKASDAKPPVITAVETIGPRLLRRLADGWSDGTFRRLYEGYQDALRQNGHDQRGQNTFGTFLAAAHTLLGDEGLEQLGLESQNLGEWGSKLAADAAPETANKQANWISCIEALFTAQVDAWNKGERRTVGQLLGEFFDERKGDNPLTETMVNHSLAPAGLALVKPGLDRENHCLAVPQSGRDISTLLRDTKYAGRGPEGSWSYALQQAPENIVLKQITLKGRDKATNRVSIASVQRRCTFIDLVELRKWQETQG